MEQWTGKLVMGKTNLLKSLLTNLLSLQGINLKKTKMYVV